MLECLMNDFEETSGAQSPSIGTGTDQILIQRPGKRRPGARFPRSSVRILEEWLSEHRQSPYPTPADQDELKAKTGLKRSQISNWFSNARKRGKVPLSQPPKQLVEQNSQASFIFSQIANLHPFERWLHLGEEHELAALPAILKAVERLNETSEDRAKISTLIRRGDDGISTIWEYFCTSGSSVSSMDIRSYAANIKSVHSSQWKDTEEPSTVLSRSSRRHRRLPSKGQGSVKDDSGRIVKKFQCTFCPDRFKTKYDWQRHEKSQHLPLEKWTCSLNGSVNVDPATNEISCVFCGHVDPSPDHMKEHNYTSCVRRPLTERTFYRKDHLRQHLRLMHGKCVLQPSMDLWKSAASTIRSRCGFCDAVFDTWDDRINHIAEHFSAGAMMSEWTGDWGFDEAVLKILERASLPWKGQDQNANHDFTGQSFLDDCDYGLFLDLESSQFDTEISAGYQNDESDIFDPGFVWDGSLEIPANGCAPEMTHNEAPEENFCDNLFASPQYVGFADVDRNLQQLPYL